LAPGGYVNPTMSKLATLMVGVPTDTTMWLAANAQQVRKPDGQAGELPESADHRLADSARRGRRPVTNLSVRISNHRAHRHGRPVRTKFRWPTSPPARLRPIPAAIKEQRHAYNIRPLIRPAALADDGRMACGFRRKPTHLRHRTPRSFLRWHWTGIDILAMAQCDLWSDASPA